MPRERERPWPIGVSQPGHPYRARAAEESPATFRPECTMLLTVHELEAEARLPTAAERAELAQRLFASLEDEEPAGSEAEVEHAWLEEADRRYDRHLVSCYGPAGGAGGSLGDVAECLKRTQRNGEQMAKRKEERFHRLLTGVKRWPS